MEEIVPKDGQRGWPCHSPLDSPPVTRYEQSLCARYDAELALRLHFCLSVVTFDSDALSSHLSTASIP